MHLKLSAEQPTVLPVLVNKPLVLTSASWPLDLHYLAAEENPASTSENLIGNRPICRDFKVWTDEGWEAEYGY